MIRWFLRCKVIGCRFGMEDPNKTFTPNPPKKILVANSGSVAGGKQFVVTQSKGTTIIQPAVVHGSSNSAQQPQYIVTGYI